MHDFNGGIKPIFWTVQIPDDAVTHGADGSVRLRAVDVPVVDDLVFSLPAGAEIPARVSFDVIYRPFGSVRHLRPPANADPTDPHNFAAELRLAISEGFFAGTNAAGFEFMAMATNDTEDFPGFVFGEMGTERNGRFLK